MALGLRRSLRPRLIYVPSELMFGFVFVETCYDVLTTYTRATTAAATQVETFFLEALEEVRRRIVNGRQAQYRRAVAEYNMRVREASRNRTKFPKIRYSTCTKRRYFVLFIRRCPCRTNALYARVSTIIFVVVWITRYRGIVSSFYSSAAARGGC